MPNTASPDPLSFGLNALAADRNVSPGFREAVVFASLDQEQRGAAFVRSRSFYKPASETHLDAIRTAPTVGDAITRAIDLLITPNMRQHATYFRKKWARRLIEDRRDLDRILSRGASGTTPKMWDAAQVAARVIRMAERRAFRAEDAATVVDGECDSCGRTGELTFVVAHGIDAWACPVCRGVEPEAGERPALVAAE